MEQNIILVGSNDGLHSMIGLSAQIKDGKIIIDIEDLPEDRKLLYTDEELETFKRYSI